MSIDMGYFKAIQGSSNLTSNAEVKIREAANNISISMRESIHFKASATRNGIKQPLIIVPTKISYKCGIEAFPNDSLFVGDIIFNEGTYWLVVETNIANPFQTTGTAWLCNQLFRFQNSSSKIIEKWGVLDSGTYSRTGDKQIQIVDDKYKIYLPYDEDTKKLHIDKRLATNKAFNSSGKEILVTYTITSIDSVSRSYGKNGHLLVLDIESGLFDENADSLSELICNYIVSTESGGSTNLLPCSISGRSSLRTGTSFTFTATFFKSDGITVDSNIVAVWNITPTIPGITSVINGNSIKISAINKESLVGESFAVSVVDSNGLYNTATNNVEVT